jgi:hypothetical protein
MGARPGGGLDGNRIWRVQLEQGVVLQKLYAERGGALHAWARELGSRLRGGKTSTLAAGRLATERRLLALWRQAGLAVPADLTGQHPDLANERTLVLEWVDGRLLSDLLVDPETPADERARLLAAFAGELSRRHRLALERSEAGLILEHAGVQHVLVAGDRLVTFDLENGFRPRADPRPLIFKELAGTVRSLARLAAEDRLGQDLEAFVGAYEPRELLEGTVRHYLQNPHPAWRLVWRLDRWREARRGPRTGKYPVLERLDEVLRGVS